MKDVILIGLGEFGERTVRAFNEIEEERKALLPEEKRGKISVYSMAYKNNNRFNYAKVSNRITSLVDKSDSKNSKKPFSYVFIGDLYEDITSKYAVEYAMVPLILDRDNVLKRDKDNVLGFFTFSDRLESQLKCSPDKMTSILNFFKKIEKADVDNIYRPEYKDTSGLRIKEIICPSGPFSRNYIVVTPGDEDSVLNMTSQIFAERIFYELYYLLDDYKEKANHVAALRTEKSRNCFSSFAMAQVSRLDELQKYYLTYCLEEAVTDYLLRNEIRGTNLDALENKFLSMLDLIDKNKESTYKRGKDGYTVKFPIDRAVSLFVKKFKHELKGVIPSYINLQHSDEKDYVELCKERISKKVYDLLPVYDDFVKSEIQHMHGELEKGYVSLFKIDKLTGNILSYIKYVTDVKNIFGSWTEDLRSLSSSLTAIDITRKYEAVQKKIRRYQRLFIYKLPFFRPVRKMLINNAILELPLKEYLENEIKRNLVASFLKQWEDDSSHSVSPVHTCEIIIRDLERLKEKLHRKRIMVKHKKAFISTLPTHYYIISQLKQDEYTDLLDKIYAKEFGPGKEGQIESIARDLFKRWTTKGEGIMKDWQDITKDPAGFISHVDKYLFDEAKRLYANVGIESRDDEKYASGAVQTLEERVKALSESSFVSSDKTSYITENKLLFKPVLNQEDYIDDRLGKLPGEINRIDVNKDFTLGAVVCFQDYLYMEYRNLCHYEDLFRKYESEKPAELVFAEPDESCEEDEPLIFSCGENSDILDSPVPEAAPQKARSAIIAPEFTANPAGPEESSAEPETTAPEPEPAATVPEPEESAHEAEPDDTEADETEETDSDENSEEADNDRPPQFVDDDDLDILAIHSRLLLNEFFDEEFRYRQFQKIFGEKTDELSAGNINAIAKNSRLEDLLRQLDIDKIHDYCKEIGLEDIFSDKETQIEAILNSLNNAEDE